MRPTQIRELKMKNRFVIFFILLLVLTIGLSACDKENNPIDENPYANLSQIEIVTLLEGRWLISLNAPQVRMIDTVRNILSNSNGLIVYRNDVGIIEFNRNQKKSLMIGKSYDGTIRNFNYIENLTSFLYYFESGTSEPIKSRTTLNENIWSIPYIISSSYGYERFTWSVEGRVFFGVEKQEQRTVTYTIELNEKEQLISVELTDDTPWDLGIFSTFSYENINPIFPEGFNKDDFIELE